MPLEARLLTGLAIALAVVYWATPVAIRVAERFEFYDKPRGYKGHARPTPYLGGSALVLGFLVALLLLASDWERTLPVAGGVLALWAVGTIDDRRTVLWWLRVLIEVGLAAGLWAADLGWSLGLGGAVDLAATAVWVVVVVNAFNLFDNMDGQSSTMGLVCASGIAVLGLVNDDPWLAIAGTALAGACVGFLPHNLLAQPARIFLGDGGSMPLGFAAAALAMVGASQAAASEWQALALGLLLVGVPALDTCLVIVSRRRRGLSILTAGRDHLTHRAHQRLRTAIAVAVALGSAQVVLSLLAVAAAQGGALALGGSAVLYLVGVGVVVALVDTRIPAVPPAPIAAEAPSRSRLPAWVVPEAPILVVLGVGAGISPLLSGYYESGVWAPIGLGLIVVLLATVIARPPRLQAPALLALAGLAGLALWSLVSASWADSIEQAVIEANRTFALAAALALLVVLVRDARTALWAFGAFAATALVVIGVEVVRLLGGDAASMFVGGRLDDPLGYINAQATFVLLLMWPAIAIAEQRRSAVCAGLAAAVATVCGGLLLLSQSRGAALALIVSAVLVLALAPGRLRRMALLIVVGGAVAIASSELLDVFRTRVVATGAVDASTVHDGVGLLLAVAAATGAAWGLAVAAQRSLTAREPELAVQVRRGLGIALAVAAAVAVLGGLASSGSVRDEVRGQYDAFVHLSVGQGGEQTASRLLSGGGNRYDYWRVAARTARDSPLRGIGAGNYDEPYFRERTTTEDIRQPHSLLLQALSELGAIGLLLALAFLAAVGWAAWRWRAAARSSQLERALLCAALGSATAWAVHTQVDWIHLLPGVTAVALIAAAVLLRPIGKREPARRAGPPMRAAIAVAVALPVAIAGVSLSRQVLAEHYRGEARDALAAGDPAEAIRQADRSLRLDPEALGAYYTKAAAVARGGDGDGARRILQAARRREPGDFLPDALLGDLAVRQRDFDAAAAYYRAALERNPREPSLVLLAKDPRAATGRR